MPGLWELEVRRKTAIENITKTKACVTIQHNYQEVFEDSEYRASRESEDEFRKVMEQSLMTSLD
jgi:hypothetical protein